MELEKTEKKLPESVKQELLRQFELKFPELEIELRNLLGQYENDLLEKSRVDNLLCLFSKRLEIKQNEFLQAIQAKGKAGDISRCQYSDDQTAEIVAGVGGAVATASALTLITWTTATTTWFFWTTTTTVTAGSLLGGLVGASAGVATGGAALLVGGLLGYGVYKARLKSRREHIKKQILEHWEKVIKPQLRNWAKKQLDNIRFI